MQNRTLTYIARRHALYQVLAELLTSASGLWAGRWVLMICYIVFIVHVDSLSHNCHSVVEQDFVSWSAISYIQETIILSNKKVNLLTTVLICFIHCCCCCCCYCCHVSVEPIRLVWRCSLPGPAWPMHSFTFYGINNFKTFPFAKYPDRVIHSFIHSSFCDVG